MPTFPIVLVHGIARFDILVEILRNKLQIPESVAGDQIQYFKGIKSHLEANGFTVFHTNQSFAGSADLRAEQLRSHINDIVSTTGSTKVHVIGHSMGGLDARHMIVDKEWQKRWRRSPLSVRRIMAHRSRSNSQSWWRSVAACIGESH